jgi:antitoxin (DNA-binding transcriptional repressor) of toxin-antitoxin stability system
LGAEIGDASGTEEPMPTKIVTVEEAVGHLFELIGLVEQGEEVVITYDDQPKVKLVPIVKPPHNRVFGQHRGHIWMRPDFDHPLPDDFWLSGSP